jgi:hypothetical protein
MLCGFRLPEVCPTLAISRAMDGCRTIIASPDINVNWLETRLIFTILSHVGPPRNHGPQQL